MRIMVTGGAGFIGSHLVDAFVADGHEVGVLDDFSNGKEENLNPAAEVFRSDISDPSVEEALARFRPDILSLHAAQPSVVQSVRDPVHDARVNVQGMIRLLEAAVKTDVGKVIFASSGGTVYGAADSFPVREDAPLRALSPYGVTKIAGEHYLRFYGNEYGLRFTILRYGNVFGPRQDPHGEAGVVAIFCQKLLDDLEASVFGAEHKGDPGCTRDYVYVADVVRANVLVLDGADGETINIGTGVGSTTLSVYEGIAAALGLKHQAPAYGPPRPGDLPRMVLDPSLAADRIGWRPQTDLRTGLAESARYYKKKK